MITFDTFISYLSAFGLLVIGLLVLYFVFSQLRLRKWYRCPVCNRWQDECGRYGFPPTRELIGGENTCSMCQRIHRDDGFRRDVSDAELARRIARTPNK